MAIRWDKFTVKSQEAIQAANEIASQNGNPEVLPVHLLAALLQDREGIVVPVLTKLGVNTASIEAQAADLIGRMPKVSGGGAMQALLSSAGQKLLDQATKEADRFKDEYVSTEHILLAMAREKGNEAYQLLISAGEIGRAHV